MKEFTIIEVYQKLLAMDLLPDLENIVVACDKLFGNWYVYYPTSSSSSFTDEDSSISLFEATITWGDELNMNLFCNIKSEQGALYILRKNKINNYPIIWHSPVSVGSHVWMINDVSNELKRDKVVGFEMYNGSIHTIKFERAGRKVPSCIRFVLARGDIAPPDSVFNKPYQDSVFNKP